MDWEVELNVKKCIVVYYGKNNVMIDYFMHDQNGIAQRISSSNGEKDLGVIFSSDLKWQNQVNLSVNKANKILGILRNGFSRLSKNAFKLLYQSLVRPQLEYAICVWSPVQKRDINMLEKVQERATKLVDDFHGIDYVHSIKEEEEKKRYIVSIEYLSEST